MNHTHELPLTPTNRLRVAEAFRHNPRVDYSLDCVIEGQMGRAYVDDPERPSAWRVTVGELVLELAPLMDDQEMDARASTGTVCGSTSSCAVKLMVAIGCDVTMRGKLAGHHASTSAIRDSAVLSVRSP